jgi:hypothetical protein
MWFFSSFEETERGIAVTRWFDLNTRDSSTIKLLFVVPVEAKTATLRHKGAALSPSIALPGSGGQGSAR